MSKTTLKAIAAAALIGMATLMLAAPAEAGRGYGHGRYHGGGGGNALAAGILGLGVGAIIGSALTPREVYVAPPPPAYPVSYGPPAWSPEWYNYCSYRYRTFNPRTGYFIGYDGYPHFCY
jgi:BA14K-like protein